MIGSGFANVVPVAADQVGTSTAVQVAMTVATEPRPNGLRIRYTLSNSPLTFAFDYCLVGDRLEIAIPQSELREDPQRPLVTIAAPVASAV